MRAAPVRPVSSGSSAKHSKCRPASGLRWSCLPVLRARTACWRGASATVRGAPAAEANSQAPSAAIPPGWRPVELDEDPCRREAGLGRHGEVVAVAGGLVTGGDEAGQAEGDAGAGAVVAVGRGAPTFYRKDVRGCVGGCAAESQYRVAQPRNECLAEVRLFGLGRVGTALPAPVPQFVSGSAASPARPRSARPSPWPPASLCRRLGSTPAGSWRRSPSCCSFWPWSPVGHPARTGSRPSR